MAKSGPAPEKQYCGNFEHSFNKPNFGEDWIHDSCVHVRVDAKMQKSDAPACPICGCGMYLRKATTGRNAGKEFWGCSNYPECKGIINKE